MFSVHFESELESKTGARKQRENITKSGERKQIEVDFKQSGKVERESRIEKVMNRSGATKQRENWREKCGGRKQKGKVIEKWKIKWSKDVEMGRESRLKWNGSITGK